MGDDDDEPEFASSMELEEGTTFFFQPRALKNLVLVDEIDSLAPIMSCQIADLANEDTPQLYAACGRGPRSSLRVLRHGLEVGSCNEILLHRFLIKTHVMVSSLLYVRKNENSVFQIKALTSLEISRAGFSL